MTKYNNYHRINQERTTEYRVVNRSSRRRKAKRVSKTKLIIVAAMMFGLGTGFNSLVHHAMNIIETHQTAKVNSEEVKGNKFEVTDDDYVNTVSNKPEMTSENNDPFTIANESATRLGLADVDSFKDDDQKKELLYDLKFKICNKLNFVNMYDISEPSGLTFEELDSLVPENLKGISQYLYNQEQSDKPINALFILALANLESANGTSNIANAKNNIFSLGAYDDTPMESAISFDTKADSVKYLVNLLNKNYIKSDGSENSVADVNFDYCSKVSWTPKLVTLMRALDVKAGIIHNRLSN